MEISVVDSVITLFQNPDFLILHPKTLWTWAALILAAAATFNGLITRSKRVVLRFCKNKSETLQQSSCTYSSDDEDDDDVSCSSSSDEEDNDEDEEMENNFGDFEEMIQGQNGKCDQHFTWSCDGSVVKLWNEVPNVHVEAVLLDGTGSLKVWDARAHGEACVSAKWQAERIARIRGDDADKLTVVDLRNLRAPLAERWRSGDTITVGDGSWMVLT